MIRYFTLFVLISFQTLAQVGIGTTSPTASLDIDGDLRIRNVDQEFNTEVVSDSILVLGRTGSIKRVSSQDVLEDRLKSMVKGVLGGTGDLNLNLVGGQVIIPFNSTEYDLSSEFDTSTYTYTAGQDGYYHIYVQINSSSALAAATNYGVAIFKNGSTLSHQGFANLNVLAVNITPPARSTGTTVFLSEGDTVDFRIVSDLAAASIVRNDTDTYFTIHQVR